MYQISLHQLAQNCNSELPLTHTLLKQIDQLTHSYSIDFSTTKQSLCTQTWKIIQKSESFWPNISAILSYTTYVQTKLQVYILIHNRIKKNWYYQSQQLKQDIKTYLCTQSQKYNKIQMNNRNKSLFRKINNIIVQILKYQWSNIWNNYLNQICQAIINTQIYAQNYFDLLKIIFIEIFSSQSKLTSQQILSIKQQISENYTLIQQCFQKYLLPQVNINIVNNCITALDSLIDWISPYYIYFGNIINKLLVLLKITDFQVNAIICLSNILTLSNQTLVQGYLPKCYSKKRHILLQIINHIPQPQSKSTTNSIILHKSLQFLQLQKQDVQKYGQLLVFQSNESQEDNILILESLGKFIKQYVIQNQSDSQNITNLHQFIIQTSQNNNQLLNNIVQITPCPLNTNFYYQQKIIKKQIDYTQIENDRNKYIRLLKVLLNTNQSNYFRHIMVLIDQDYPKCKNKQAYTRLCKVIWNFYYYLSCVGTGIRVKQKIFTVTNRLITIQQQLQVSLSNCNLNNNNIKLSNKVISIIKMIQTLKMGILLILSHQKSMYNGIFIKPFKIYLLNSLHEQQNYIKCALTILNNCYQYIKIQDKKQIHQRYITIIKNRQNKLQIDSKYVQIIGNWIKNITGNGIKSNIQHSYQQSCDMIKNILQFYTKPVDQLQKMIINKNNKHIQQIQQKYVQHVLQLMKLAVKLLPYFKYSIICMLQKYQQIIKHIISSINYKQQNNKSVQLFTLAIEIFIGNFQYIPNQQLNNKQDKILQQSITIITFGLKCLQSQQYNGIYIQYIQCIFKYYKFFIKKMITWKFPKNKKLQIIQRILDTLRKQQDSQYLLKIGGFIELMHTIVECQLFMDLGEEYVSNIIARVMSMIINEEQAIVLKSMQIFNSMLILGININSQYGMNHNFLMPYILDIIINLYKVIIKIHSTINYIQQYSNVLFLTFIFCRGLKTTFIPEQRQDNGTVLFKQLMQATKLFYLGYPETFFEKVHQYLHSLMNLVEKKLFQAKVQDLVVVLRRGY